MDYRLALIFELILQATNTVPIFLCSMYPLSWKQGAVMCFNYNGIPVPFGEQIDGNGQPKDTHIWLSEYFYDTGRHAPCKHVSLCGFSYNNNNKLIFPSLFGSCSSSHQFICKNKTSNQEEVHTGTWNQSKLCGTFNRDFLSSTPKPGYYWTNEIKHGCSDQLHDRTELWRMPSINQLCGAYNTETGTYFRNCNDKLTFGCYFSRSTASYWPFHQCPQVEKTEPAANPQNGKEVDNGHERTGVSTKPTDTIQYLVSIPTSMSATKGTKSQSMSTSSRGIFTRLKSFETSYVTPYLVFVTDNSTTAQMMHDTRYTETADSKLTTFPGRGLFIGIGVGTAVVLLCGFVLLILLHKACSEQTQEALQLTQSKNEDHAPSNSYAGQEIFAYNTTDYREEDVEVCSHAELQKARQERGSSCETNNLSKAPKGRRDGETQHRYEGTDMSKSKYNQTRKHMNKDRDHDMVEYSLAVDVERHQEIHDVKTLDYDETGYDTTFQLRPAHCIEGNVYNKTSSTEDRRNVDNVTDCKETLHKQNKNSRYENVSSHGTCPTISERHGGPKWQDGCDRQSSERNEERTDQCKGAGEKEQLFEYSMAVDVEVRHKKETSFEQAQNHYEEYNTTFQLRQTLYPDENVYDTTNTSDDGQSFYNVTSRKKDLEKMASPSDLYDNIKKS